MEINKTYILKILFLLRFCTNYTADEICYSVYILIPSATCSNTGCFCAVSCGLKPQISEMVENVTVALGRDTILRCQVKHLADYKVIISCRCWGGTPSSGARSNT